jgi:chromosome segregation protein
MLIREIILENFMSYEYARIPLKPGVNVICGPNGAGKSSILLGISVALGQSYTERSRKLSDLIRWGKDQARIVLVLNNARRGNRRPVPKFNKDQIFLTRVLRRDGKYWFELENRAATKAEVQRLLGKFGVDPENMLVIMHQNMTEQFTVLSPQDKLKIVEAAVGLEPYRRNVLEAQKKLSRILSEEESVGKLLESAEQTLNYWREQYDRYQQKKQLIMKRRFLERELAWAEVAKREKIVEELKSQIKHEQNQLLQLGNETEKVTNQLSDFQQRLSQFKAEWEKTLEERLILEREKARNEENFSFANRNLKETESLAESSLEKIKECLRQISRLETLLNKTERQADLIEQLTQIKKTYDNLEDSWTQHFNLQNQQFKNILETAQNQLTKITKQISDSQLKMESLSKEMEKINNDIVDQKINLALLQYKKENIEKSLEKLDKELKTAAADLEEAKEKALQTGPQIVPMKSVVEILDEIRLTDGHLAALTDVSEDIERMYESYSKLYLELKEKARLVAENREKALEEVKTRMEAWHKVIQNLLDHVNLQYQNILSQAQAVGEVKLINEHDIEAAGLEILVGFKGAKPVPLDAYTQSGGERSTATMSFLLALQQHVRSPFRAVDEYDVHMDPRNREVIANLLASSVQGLNVQYLAITPSQVSFAGKDVHIVTVQNVEGSSIIREVV